MPLRVYYLDDEKDLCGIFAEYFSSDDVVVTTFTDAAEAIEAIRRTPPDILFIDYRLIGTTGDDVARVLDPKLPKFLITGDLTVRAEFKFDKILPKPFNIAEISSLIAHAGQR